MIGTSSDIKTRKDLRVFQLNDLSFEVFVPVQLEIQEAYYEQKAVDETTPFPYWAKVWPSAIGLSLFLQSNTQYIQNKQVLELAAGLGLPSLVAAKYAASVTCSDYVEAPFHYVNASINHHQLQNINCQIINWFALPCNITADVILLSDINYEPAAFAVLFSMITNFIANKKTIILTTPQRLLAKPFIEKLLPFCKVQTQIAVIENEQSVWIQVLVLQP